MSSARGGAPARMMAWRLHSYGGAQALRLEAARRPALRAPDELLVRVRAAGVNPLDARMCAGYGARALDALRRLHGEPAPALPLVCGREFLGTVERSGPAARLRCGQRVWGVVPPHRAGAHAQFVVVRDAWAGPAPAALDDAACGGAPFAALSACAAVRASGARRGSRVLVLGLGGVGQAAVQLLAARGVRVVAGCAGELGALARRLGAEETLDRHAAEYEARVARAGPYAAVVDAAGLGAAGLGGRAWRGARYVTLSPPLLAETDARGLWCGAAAATAQLAGQRAAHGAPVRWAVVAPRGADLERVRRLAEARRFAVAVTRVERWAAAPAALAAAARGGARGKLVLDWSDCADPLCAALADVRAHAQTDHVENA